MWVHRVDCHNEGDASIRWLGVDSGCSHSAASERSRAAVFVINPVNLGSGEIICSSVSSLAAQLVSSSDSRRDDLGADRGPEF